MFRLLLVCLALLYLAPAARAGEGPSARGLDAVLAAGVLKVGSTGDYRPFSYKDPASGDFLFEPVLDAQQVLEWLGLTRISVEELDGGEPAVCRTEEIRGRQIQLTVSGDVAAGAAKDHVQHFAAADPGPGRADGAPVRGGHYDAGFRSGSGKHSKRVGTRGGTEQVGQR